MRCLSCGSENAYGSVRCGSCGRDFPADPPFIDSNHICQLQVAVQDCLGGELPREELSECYGRFLNLFGQLDGRWGILEGGSLMTRAAGLPAPTRRALAELDRAFNFLQNAMGMLDDYLESEDTELLPGAVESLEDFFRIVCQGCAALLHREEVKKPESGPGVVLDVKSD